MASVAELERNVIAERTADALRYKRQKNEKTGGDVPFGYRLSEQEGVKMLIPHKHEQRVIREVQRMRGEGMSYRAIAQELEHRRVRTKQGRTTWSAIQVSRVAQSVRLP